MPALRQTVEVRKGERVMFVHRHKPRTPRGSRKGGMHHMGLAKNSVLLAAQRPVHLNDVSQLLFPLRKCIGAQQRIGKESHTVTQIMLQTLSDTNKKRKPVGWSKLICSQHLTRSWKLQMIPKQTKKKGGPFNDERSPQDTYIVKNDPKREKRNKKKKLGGSMCVVGIPTIFGLILSRAAQK